MKLKINVKNKPFYITEIEFKENGAMITQADGTKDVYTYKWLNKQEAIIKDDNSTI